MPAKSIFCVTIFVLQSFTLFAQKGCSLKKDQDSIKVYLCNNDTAKLKFIRAEFWLNASMTRLVTEILDVEHYVDWQYQTIQARIVNPVDNNEVVYYTEIDAPWPVTNRDIVAHLTVTQDSQTKVLTITSNGEPDALPKESDKVRVPLSRSQWTVVPVGEKLLKVDYFIQIDPGGSVPAWMINMVAAEAPFETFQNLRKRIVIVRKDSPVDVSFIVD